MHHAPRGTSRRILLGALVTVGVACGSSSPSEIGAGFRRLSQPLHTGEPASAAFFFAEPWSASFEVGPDGSLLGAAKTGQQLLVRLPATAAGRLRVEVAGAAGVWVEEQLVDAHDSARAQQVAGRVVYVLAKRGVDRVYEVSAERVEEYVRISDERAASELAWEVETGPGIADLVVDGSGLGLVAVDSTGRALLKAPQPLGIDSLGAPLLGKLVATPLGSSRFTLRLEWPRGLPRFPVLLDPGWVSTGSMTIGRAGHSATLLPNGVVLVAGGYDIAAAELYDVASGTWSATGAMLEARSGHTATLLTDGRVLVAGGYRVDGIQTAELYDPAAGTWSAAGYLSAMRESHTATLLADGTVLVASGGNNSTSVLATADIYDPADGGHWRSTPPMIGARQIPTSTLLADGKVLVTGGATFGVGASAELYDPADGGAWRATGSMAAPRLGHTATLLANGKVLVVGGGSIGAEVYDPTTGTFTTTGSPADPRLQHTAERLQSGKVLVIGGGGAMVLARTSTELYDPTLGTWSATTSLSTARVRHTSTMLPNGQVLVAGGVIGALTYSASAELYDLGGLPCAAPADCPSGFCVDGVCCDTACGGALVDCQACNVDAGAVTNGTCAVAVGGTVCRAEAGACDHAERCDGAATACPVDTFETASNFCRPAVGVCNLPEKCTGSSAQCPGNAFSPDGTACDGGTCGSGACVSGAGGGIGAGGGAAGAGGGTGTGGGTAGKSGCGCAVGGSSVELLFIAVLALAQRRKMFAAPAA